MALMVEKTNIKKRGPRFMKFSLPLNHFCRMREDNPSFRIPEAPSAEKLASVWNIGNGEEKTTGKPQKASNCDAG
jgi:hypothetical protein